MYQDSIPWRNVDIVQALEGVVMLALLPAVMDPVLVEGVMHVSKHAAMDQDLVDV